MNENWLHSRRKRSSIPTKRGLLIPSLSGAEGKERKGKDERKMEENWEKFFTIRD